MPLPLERIRVVDFSTLLPGPLATLMLARAGATVVKIEPPGGEGMRRLGLGSAAADRAAFDLLNAGKRSVCADLKSERDAKRVRALIRGADVLVEQFRPGVMQRLGFGYAAMKELNPGLIYCSITGYGADGPLSGHAGHDLNYMARSGVLGLSPGTQGAGCVPPVLAADIAGGSYPAFFNILLALLARGQGGEGQHIQVAMAENLFPFAFWALASGWGGGVWPSPAAGMLTGGSARYRLYRTKDNRFVALGAIEDKFWREFCRAIGLPDALAQMDSRKQEVAAAVAQIIASHDACHWRGVFEAADCCATLVERLEDAVRDPHFVARGLFPGGKVSPAPAGGSGPVRLPLPLSQAFDALAAVPQGVKAPEAGADDALLEQGWAGLDAGDEEG